MGTGLPLASPRPLLRLHCSWSAPSASACPALGLVPDCDWQLPSQGSPLPRLAMLPGPRSLGLACRAALYDVGCPRHELEDLNSGYFAVFSKVLAIAALDLLPQAHDDSRMCQLFMFSWRQTQKQKPKSRQWQFMTTMSADANLSPVSAQPPWVRIIDRIQLALWARFSEDPQESSRTQIAPKPPHFP